MIKLVADEVGVNDHNSLRNTFKIRKRAENIIILDITATALTPEEAVKLSKTFASLSPEYLSAIFPNALVNVVAEAEGAVIVSPKTVQTTALAFMVGFFLAFIIFLIIDMFFPNCMYSYLLKDPQLELIGICDKIEIIDGKYYPIIIKNSNPPIKGVWNQDSLELVAHAILLEEEFDTEEGKALLKKWGIDERFRGVGHCILGYADGALPAARPRKEDYIVRI